MNETDEIGGSRVHRTYVGGCTVPSSDRNIKIPLKSHFIKLTFLFYNRLFMKFKHETETAWLLLRNKKLVPN